MISSIIELSSFETIKTKIAQILSLEIANQITLINAEIALVGTTAERLAVLQFYKSALPTSVWEDRFLDPGTDELPYLNVVFVKSPQDELITHGSQVGVNSFIVESWQESPTTSAERGDTLSSKKLERVLAVASAILKDRLYTQLGLPGVIGSRTVTEIEIVQPSTDASKNSDNLIYGKFIVSVKSTETVREISGIPWAQTTTDVQLGDSEKGFQWIATI